VSLNEGADSDSEAGGEDAAAEAAWAEMELQAENAENGGGASSGAALGKALALVGPETQKKINRTLLRRRRKAANKDGKEPMDRTWAKKISGKPRRETMLPGMEDHLEPEDCPAYGKRPKPNRHINKKSRDRRVSRGAEDGTGSSKKKTRKREGGANKGKTGDHFYNAVDIKGKRRRMDRPN